MLKFIFLSLPNLVESKKKKKSRLPKLAPKRKRRRRIGEDRRIGDDCYIGDDRCIRDDRRIKSIFNGEEGTHVDVKNI